MPLAALFPCSARFLAVQGLTVKLAFRDVQGLWFHGELWLTSANAGPFRRSASAVHAGSAGASLRWRFPTGERTQGNRVLPS